MQLKSILPFVKNIFIIAEIYVRLKRAVLRKVGFKILMKEECRASYPLNIIILKTCFSFGLIKSDNFYYLNFRKKNFQKFNKKFNLIFDPLGVKKVSKICRLNFGWGIHSNCLDIEAISFLQLSPPPVRILTKFSLFRPKIV